MSDKNVNEKSGAKKARASETLSALRDFPKALCELCRREFPEAATNTDAVVAYMTVFCPEVADSHEVDRALTDRQKDLVMNHANGIYTQLSERMSMMNGKIDRLCDMEFLAMAAAYYNMYDRMIGLPGGMPNAETFAGFEPDVDSRFQHFSQYADEKFRRFKRNKDMSDGRPRKGAGEDTE